MKTPDEIKKGLKCCLIALCKACPYGNDPGCTSKNLDALAYIQQLEAQVPKWRTMCDEQKPKHGQEYFIRYGFCVNGIKLSPKFYGVAKYHTSGSNGYVDGPHFDNEGTAGMFVTHWMEIPLLPEDPKEGIILEEEKA